MYYIFFIYFQANIQSIMASEDQVNSLMDLLEAALAELDKLDTRLTQYDGVLKVMFVLLF